MGLFTTNKKILDYYFVNSNKEIDKLVRKGELYPMYLIPPTFNGEDFLNNKVYVPYQILKIKDKYDGKAYKLLKKGKVNGYICNPEYKGNSFVPSKLHIEVNKDGKIIYHKKINIW